MLPVRLRHDDETFHVPTTLPPQGDTLLQAGPPPVPVVPPVAAAPPVPSAPPMPTPPVLVAPPFEVAPPVPVPESVLQPGPTAPAANAKAPTRPKYPFRMNNLPNWWRRLRARSEARFARGSTTRAVAPIWDFRRTRQRKALLPPCPEQSVPKPTTAREQGKLRGINRVDLRASRRKRRALMRRS
jgi:hypothetical protein